MTIASNITQLEIESAKDTLALIANDTLQKALSGYTNQCLGSYTC